MDIREIVEQHKKKELIVQRVKSTKQVRLVGESMLPTLCPSETKVLFVSNCTSYQPGDIVAFVYDKSLMGVSVHRIIKISGDRILTKGDNNTFSDDLIEKNSVLGKVEKAMQNDGRVIDVCSSRTIAFLSRAENYINRMSSNRFSGPLHRICFKLYEMLGGTRYDA